jgi:hypothetical protein
MEREKESCKDNKQRPIPDSFFFRDPHYLPKREFVSLKKKKNV